VLTQVSGLCSDAVQLFKRNIHAGQRYFVAQAAIVQLTRFAKKLYSTKML
jgi:hypothetical protein